jgi:thiol:disulfide interchange protein DsbC
MRIFFSLFAMIWLFSSPAIAFKPTAEDGKVGDCKSCHVLSKEAASEVFKGFQGEVVSVDFAEAPGLWQIGMENEGKTYPIYLDFSKTYLISGNLIRLKDRKNLTEEKFRQLNPVDLSLVPTDDALLLGNPEAEKKVIVFTDPHCPYCVKLHEVLKEIVAERSDLLFQIKLLPLKASSKKVAETIACTKSMEQLEAAFARQEIPEVSCENKIIEQNLAIAQSLGVRGTPALILPNGQIAPGYKPLDALLKLIDQATESD